MKAARIIGQQQIDLIDGLRGKTNKRGGRLIDSDMIPRLKLEHALFIGLYSDITNPSRWIKSAVTEKLLEDT
jgi:hypothetical protein